MVERRLLIASRLLTIGDGVRYKTVRLLSSIVDAHSRGRSLLMDAVLLSVAALACPIGMGAMMWFMARGMRRKPDDPDHHAAPRSIEELREDHRRLGREIERHENDPKLTGTRS
jgi:hypothetical protein